MVLVEIIEGFIAVVIPHIVSICPCQDGWGVMVCGGPDAAEAKGGIVASTSQKRLKRRKDGPQRKSLGERELKWSFPGKTWSVTRRVASHLSTKDPLRVTPAMEAGIADHVWEISELLA